MTFWRTSSEATGPDRCCRTLTSEGPRDVREPIRFAKLHVHFEGLRAPIHVVIAREPETG